MSEYETIPRKTITQIIMEREAKVAKLTGKARSSAAPPKKKRKVVSSESTASADKGVPAGDIIIFEGALPVIDISEGAGKEVEKGKGCDPTPLPKGLNEVDGPSIIDEDNLFCMFLHLLHEDRPVTLDDSALKDAWVAYAIAQSVTPPVDMAILECLGTPELGLMGNQCLVIVSFFILFLVITNESPFLQAIHHFSEYNYQHLKMLKDAKEKKKECKPVIEQLKKEVSDPKGAYDSKAKELADTKESNEKELQSLRDQVASLKKSFDDE